MVQSPTSNRRTMLWLMGSTLAAMTLARVVPVQSAAKARGCLPGSLSLLPLDPTLVRQARYRLDAHPKARRLYHVAQTYVHAADHPRVLERFEAQVRQDFRAGRIAVVDGWVVADTELALLALVQHSQCG